MGDVPPSLTARICIALNEIREARADEDPSREWAWSQIADRLLDAHLRLLQASGRFRPLETLDPALSARLTVR